MALACKLIKVVMIQQMLNWGNWDKFCAYQSSTHGGKEDKKMEMSTNVNNQDAKQMV